MSTATATPDETPTRSSGPAVRHARTVVAVAVGVVLLLLFTLGRGWIALGTFDAPLDAVAAGRIWRGLDREIVVATPGPGTLSVDLRSSTLLEAAALGEDGTRSPATAAGIGLQRFELPVAGGTTHLHVAHVGETPLARFEVRTRFVPAPATLTVGSRRQLSLRPGAENRFGIEVDAAGWLRVHSIGDVDLTATLLAAEGTPLATDDDGGAGGNFAVQARVQPGLHTLVVRGATAEAGGRYAIETRLADRQPLRIRVTPASARVTLLGGEPFENGMLLAPGDLTLSVSAPGYSTEMLQLTHSPFEPTSAEVVLRDDHGDDVASATPAAIGATLSGGLGVDDRDVFAFTAAEAGDYRFESAGDLDTYGRLYDAEGNELATNDDGSDIGSGYGFLLPRSLAAGETIYVEVSAYGTGTGLYDLYSRLVPPDDHVDGIGDGATVLTADGGATGRLTDGDRDVFRISISEPVNLELSAESPMDTYGRLYDAAGDQIASNDDGGIDSNFLIRTLIREPQDVYLEVSGYGDDEVGDYRLVMRTTEVLPDDHGDVPAQATPLGLDASTTGRLEAGDLDVFRIDVPEPMGLEIRSDSAMDTLGRLQDADGNEIATNDDGGADANFLMLANVTTPGPVYLFVSGYGDDEVGLYTIVTRSSALFEDDHGNTLGDATPMETGTTVEGRLTPGDVDVFAFSVPGPGAFEALAYSPFDSVGRLLDASGNEIATDDDSGTGNNFLLRTSLPAAGDYFVEIRGYGDDDVGDYRIETRLQP